MDRLEKITQQGFDNTERRFNNLTKHIDEHTSKLGERLDKYDHKIDKMDQRLWTNFYWMLGTLFTLSAAGAGILAKGFKWLT
jgi:flagellar capping protein FliD